MKKCAITLKECNVRPSIFIIIAGVVSMISSLGAPLVPEIANYYHIVPTLAQWSLTIALISGTVSTPILAKISRTGNYRNVILITLIATMLGCFLSALASNFSIFLIGRSIQGIGLGLIPSLMIAAQNSLSDSKKTISLLSVTTGIGVGIGYPLSGIMVTYAGIGGTFLYGGIIVLFTAIISTKLINFKKETRGKFDTYGSILITIVLSFLILLLGSLKSNLDPKNIVIYSIGFSAALFLWIKSEAKSTNPIISVRVIMLPQALIANLIALFSGAILYMLITASIFRIQQPSYPGLSETPMMAGLTLTFLSVATLVSRFINLNNINNYLKSIIGSTFLFFSLMSFIYVNGGIIFCFIAMALCGYGIGLIYGSIPQIIKENLNKDDGEETYGLNQVSRSIGYAIGSVISINIIYSFFLNNAGEASKYSYITLGITGSFFVIILYCLIMLIWYYHKFRVKGPG
ncbi:MAG: transporter [Gammaproteobacteria bacterium]|jgi:MFS family permease|nr:transporter [Gammaproteobacteria bacterium]